MKMIVAMVAGSLFSAAFGLPRWGFALAFAASLAIAVYHSL